VPDEGYNIITQLFPAYFPFLSFISKHYLQYLAPNHRQSVLSTDQEKIPARNSIYAHAQDFAESDVLLLAFVLQPLNKHHTVVFHVFTYTRHL